MKSFLDESVFYPCLLPSPFQDSRTTFDWHSTSTCVVRAPARSHLTENLSKPPFSAGISTRHRFLCIFEVFRGFLRVSHIHLCFHQRLVSLAWFSVDVDGATPAVWFPGTQRHDVQLPPAQGVRPSTPSGYLGGKPTLFDHSNARSSGSTSTTHHTHNSRFRRQHLLIAQIPPLPIFTFFHHPCIFHCQLHWLELTASRCHCIP